MVPYKNAAILQDKLLPNSQLKIYPASRTGCIPPTPILSTPICWRLSAPDLPYLPGRVPLMAFRQRPGASRPGAPVDVQRKSA